MKEVFFCLLAFLVHSSKANDAEAIRTMCRFRVGNFAHPNPTMCDRYVICALVDGLVQPCPRNTIFSFQPERACVPGLTATCQRLSTAPPVSPDIPKSDDICSDIDFGFLPDPRTCRGFIICINSNPLPVPCEEEFPVFNPTTLECVAGNPDTCEIDGTTSTVPDETTTLPDSPETSSTTTEPTPTDETTTSPDSPETSSTTSEPTAPDETTTSPDSPETSSTTTEPTATDETTTSPDSPETSSTTSEPTAPDETTTSPDDTTTQEPTTTSEEPTESEVPTTTEEATTTTPTPGNLCLGVISGFLPHPTTCYLYYWCFLGIPHPRECQIDRIFEDHPATPGCVLGNRDTCQRID